MSRRYSNILQGTELKKAQDALETYRRTRQTKRSSLNPSVGKARPKTEIVVKPFDTDVPDKVIVSIVRASLAELKDKLGTRVKDDQVSLATGLRLTRFRPARIHLFKPSAAVPTYVKSKATGLNYIKYPGDSYSSPFGAGSNNEEESAGARAVKSALLAVYKKDYTRVWYESERISI